MYVSNISFSRKQMVTRCNTERKRSVSLFTFVLFLTYLFVLLLCTYTVQSADWRMYCHTQGRGNLIRQQNGLGVLCSQSAQLLWCYVPTSHLLPTQSVSPEAHRMLLQHELHRLLFQHGARRTHLFRLEERLETKFLPEEVRQLRLEEPLKMKFLPEGVPQ